MKIRVYFWNGKHDYILERETEVKDPAEMFHLTTLNNSSNSVCAIDSISIDVDTVRIYADKEARR